METDGKIQTTEESLRIITEMISRTKVNIRQGSFHLLFWGWLIFACSLSEYLLIRFTGFDHPWYVWFLVIPGVFVSMIFGYITGRREKVYTYADSISMWTWIAFLFAAIILYILLAGSMETFSPFILTLAGIPTFISGFIIRFKPLIIGGITFWIFALIAHFAGPAVSPLAMPVAMLTGYLIPGYMLKRQANHETL